MAQRVVITGAFSYIGSATAGPLLERGFELHTLTNREPPAGATSITQAPLRFEPGHLVRELEGADVFINTFWIRLPHGGQTFASAAERIRMLFAAAKQAGVAKIVHVSVSNAEDGRNLGYYGGKADVEASLRELGVSYSIVKPTLVVGPADILTSNIIWLLRRFPFFPVPRGGRCRLQPVTLADTGRIVADAVAQPSGYEVDAAGPDIMTFRDYLALLARSCGLSRWFPSAPNWFALLGLRVVEPFLRDIVLTKEELLGLQQELLMSKAPPLGTESVVDWLAKNASAMGRRYTNDLDRHFREGTRSLPVARAV